MISFRSRDGRIGVTLTEQCLQEARRLCSAAYPQETGGILVGRYSGDRNVAHILQAAEPPTDSRFGRSWFARGVQGIRNQLSALWNQPKNQRQYYLGEWHFHPDGSPEPSPQDRSEMLAISLHSPTQCPEPVLLILAGSPCRISEGVFVFSSRDGQVRLSRV